MTLMRGEGEEYKRRQKRNATSMYKKVKADAVFESSSVASLRHEQQGQVYVEIAGFPQVEYLEVVLYTRLSYAYKQVTCSNK